MVPMREPETVVVLETAAGLVRATASCRNGRCLRVTLDMPRSFADRLGLAVEVEGLGTVKLDVAFGGVFYALVDPAPLGLAIEPGSARELVDAGMRILAAARESYSPVHPEEPGLNGIAYLMWCGHDAEGPRNATVMPPGRLDRSPCGAGSSARLAVMHARGGAQVGQPFAFRSTIGTRFDAQIAAASEIGGRPAVLPRLSGRAWIYSREQIGLDPEDPFPLGHMVADIWGPGTRDLL
jgi:proline racemase